MAGNLALRALLDRIDGPKENFTDVLEKVLSIATNLIQHTEELQEEIKDLNVVYQTFVKDVDFHFHYIVSNGSIDFKIGKHNSPTLFIEITRSQITRIVKGEVMGIEAYLKGQIKACGSLTDGLRYIKIYRLFLNYLTTKFKIKLQYY